MLFNKLHNTFLQDLTLFLRVCTEHHIPTTRYCVHAIVDENDNVKVECQNIFCRKCLFDHKSLITDKQYKELGCLLCNDHFFTYLEQQRTVGVNLDYSYEGTSARYLQHMPGNIICQTVDNESLLMKSTLPQKSK